MKRIFLMACLASNILAGGSLRSEETRDNENASDLAAFHGLWMGSWGGGTTDDNVVYQPVIAEMFVQNDGQAIWHGLPMPNGNGTLRLDKRGERRGRFEYAIGESGKSFHKPQEFSYALDGDKLTLTLNGQRDGLLLTRRATAQPVPFADLEVEFQMATRVDGDGNLLITKFSALQIGDGGPELPAPFSLKRPLANATIYRVGDTKVEKVTIANLREAIRTPTPVVIAGWSDRKRRSLDFGLAQRFGSLQPDSESGLKTLGHILRPGTFVLVVPEGERRLLP